MLLHIDNEFVIVLSLSMLTDSVTFRFGVLSLKLCVSYFGSLSTFTFHFWHSFWGERGKHSLRGKNIFMLFAKSIITVRFTDTK